MKTPIVFSLVREQSVFMTAIISLLTFLSVMALGVALCVGTGVMRWNARWDLFATVQASNDAGAAAVKKILDENANAIKTATKITDDQMADLMRPWVSGGGAALKNYLPQMWEVEFKSPADMNTVATKIDGNARFLRHATALKTSTRAGWKMMTIAGLMLILTLGAIGACISYIARNTAMLHRRELEILNQIGATDAFVARQMQIIVAKICTVAAAIGFVAAMPMLWLILSAARSARVGLMAMMGISGAGWCALILLPILIVLFAIVITRRTTLYILKNS